MNLMTRLTTMLYGKKVGEDNYGNRYYQAIPRQHFWQFWRPRKTKWGLDRRWVIYAKQFRKYGIEASAVPAEWNLWLHHTADEPINEQDQHKWQKPFIANPTGTKDAIFPKGSKAKSLRQAASVDFQAWQPK